MSEEEPTAPAAAEPLTEVDASFGVERGEVEHLEKKWESWSEEIEESKRLVIEEIEVVAIATSPFAAGSPRGPTRRRNRTGEWLIAACPFYYGYVVAGLVALAALVVSPVQVYCVGVVLGAMRLHLNISLVRISALYAAALIFAAPVMLWVHTRALALVSRKQLIASSGALFCFACALLPAASGQVTLLLVWTLMQVMGPGMLYPAVETALLQWWKVKRGRVQAVVQSFGSLLGMLVLPAVLSVEACIDYGASDAVTVATGNNASCDFKGGHGCLELPPPSPSHATLGAGCWMGAYTALGVVLLVPVAVLAGLLLEGGAADHDLLIDDGPGLPHTPAPLPMQPLDAQILSEEEPAGAVAAPLDTSRENVHLGNELGNERWSLEDALTHSSFWLAQMSFSTVHAIVNAYIFHRTDLMIDVNLEPEQSFRLQLLVALSCTLCTPVGLLVHKKEHLLLMALLLAALALLILIRNHNPGGLYVSSILMGCAFGVTNAYATVVWEYFFGRADAERIKQTSIAITSATSGSAIWVFAMSRQLMKSYHLAMNAYAALALLLAGADLLALAKPELLEAIVRHAPTWEQMLARRQREGYFSLTGQLSRQLSHAARVLKLDGGLRPAEASSVQNQQDPRS